MTSPRRRLRWYSSRCPTPRPTAAAGPTSSKCRSVSTQSRSPGAERGLIGELPGTRADAAHRWVYDGVHDASFVAAWLELIRQGESTPSGNATGHRVESGYRLPFATGTVKVLSGEQSNSSVIVDDDDGGTGAIVKFFRVLSEGENPEVEIGAALTAGRTAEVPATLGWVTGEWLAPARSGAG